jgi:hypothetical protein
MGTIFINITNIWPKKTKNVSFEYSYKICLGKKNVDSNPSGSI